MSVNQPPKEDENWKIFRRQLLVCSGAWNCYFLMGLSIGTPTVMIPQLKSLNYTMSEELESWLPVIINCSGIPWIIILSVLANAIGRKKNHIVISTSCLIGFSMIYFSESLTFIFISQIFQGSCIATYWTTSVAILSEFTSEKYKNVFLILKSATFFWGVLVANAIGTFLNWKYIAVVGIMCSIYNLITVLIWPESPNWLASKGKFIECSKSHKWLKGTGSESLKQLDYLLKSVEDKRKKNNFRKNFTSKKFLKPILLSCLLVCLHTFSGKLVFTVYALVVFTEITGDDWTAYKGMLVVGSVTVASMYIGGFLTKHLKRRTMLISFSSLAILFLFTISGYLYLIKLSLLDQNFYVSTMLLSGYSLAVCCGPMILSTTIINELSPIDSRPLFMSINAFIVRTMFSSLLKNSPQIFKALEMYGTFLLFGILSSVFLILICFFMPETKKSILQNYDDDLSREETINLKEKRILMHDNTAET